MSLKADTQNRLKWLAIVREALILAGENPSAADIVIADVTGDFRDIDEGLKDWAFHLCREIADAEKLEAVT